MADMNANQMAFRLEARYLGHGSESAITSASSSPTIVSFRFNPRARPFIPGALSHPPIPTEVFKASGVSSPGTFVFNPTAPAFYPPGAVCYLHNPFGVDEQTGFQPYTPPPVYHRGPVSYGAEHGQAVGFDSFNERNVPVHDFDYVTGAKSPLPYVPLYAFTPAATLPPYTQSSGYDVLLEYYQERPILGAGQKRKTKSKKNKKTPKSYKAKQFERLHKEFAEELLPSYEW